MYVTTRIPLYVILFSIVLQARPNQNTPKDTIESKVYKSMYENPNFLLLNELVDSSKPAVYVDSGSDNKRSDIDQINELKNQPSSKYLPLLVPQVPNDLSLSKQLAIEAKATLDLQATFKEVVNKAKNIINLITNPAIALTTNSGSEDNLVKQQIKLNSTQLESNAATPAAESGSATVTEPK